MSDAQHLQLETEDESLTLTPLDFGFLQLETVDAWNGTEARICLTLEQVEKVRHVLNTFYTAEFFPS